MDLIGIEPMTSSMPFGLLRLMRRKNRQNRPSRRYLLPKCYQNSNQWDAGSIRGELTRNTVPVGFARCNNTVVS